MSVLRCKKWINFLIFLIFFNANSEYFKWKNPMEDIVEIIQVANTGPSC